MDTKNFFRQNIEHHHFLVFFFLTFCIEKSFSLLPDCSPILFLQTLLFIPYKYLLLYLSTALPYCSSFIHGENRWKKKKEHRDVGKSCDSELVEEIESLFRFLQRWHLMAFLMPTLSKSRAIVSYWGVGAWPPCSHMHQLIAITGAHIAALAVHSSMH